MATNNTRIVVALAEAHSATWRDRPETYWLMRLVEEVGELGASLADDHKDPPEHELKQIATICMNWLDRFYPQAEANIGNE